MKRLVVVLAISAASLIGSAASADTIRDWGWYELPGGELCIETGVDDVVQTVCIPTP